MTDEPTLAQKIVDSIGYDGMIDEPTAIDNVQKILADYRSSLREQIEKMKTNCDCYDPNYCCSHGYDEAITDVIKLLDEV